MNKKKVVIEVPAGAKTEADAYGLELESLAPVADLVPVGSSTLEEFVAGSADADAIIVSWGIHFSRDLIEKLERCMVIGVGSVGVDMIDVEAATDAGIVVTNVPDVFIEEVADHTIMLMLATARRLKEQDYMATHGQWDDGRAQLSEIPRLWGQTLGLVSFGNVARAVAKRAKVFGLHILAHDPYVSELKMTGEGVEPVSFPELLERSDYLSMHPPHNRKRRKCWAPSISRA